MQALQRAALHAWREQASWQRKVRELVIEEWRQISYRLLHMPFRAWYVFTQEHKARRRAQERITRSFVRRGKYRLLVGCYKRWRQLVLFGQGGVARTREELVQALDEQKETISHLQRANDEVRAQPSRRRGVRAAYWTAHFSHLSPPRVRASAPSIAPGPGLL